MEDIVALKVKLHREYLDPLWRSAARRPCYKEARRYPEVRAKIIKRARERVYEWIAYKTGRPIDDVHVRRMDEPTCLMVMELLRDVEYEVIREWAVRRDRNNKRREKREQEVQS
jgi:hypothetical protein